MEKKKTLLIIAVCLLAAAFVALITKKKDTGVNSIQSGALVWVKCTGGDCNAEYQMEKRDYYAQVQEKRKINPMSMMNVPVDCQKCGAESLHMADKCGKCGHIFLKTAATGEHGDKCPECGYSAIEENLKQRN